MRMVLVRGHARDGELLVLTGGEVGEPRGSLETEGERAVRGRGD
jgi:hypothetical protein